MYRTSDTRGEEMSEEKYLKDGTEVRVIGKVDEGFVVAKQTMHFESR